MSDSSAAAGAADINCVVTDATTTMPVNVLISVEQFQRDLQNKLTREGLAAAWANGAKSGRRARLGVVDDVRQAFRAGSSITALAREHRVSRGAIRTAVVERGLPQRAGGGSVRTAGVPGSFTRVGSRQ